MHHKRAIAHRKRVHLSNCEIPHVRRARDATNGNDGGRTAIGPLYRLGDVQEGGDQPAVISGGSRAPGMVGGGVNHLGLAHKPVSLVEVLALILAEAVAVATHIGGAADNWRIMGGNRLNWQEIARQEGEFLFWLPALARQP